MTTRFHGMQAPIAAFAAAAVLSSHSPSSRAAGLDIMSFTAVSDGVVHATCQIRVDASYGWSHFVTSVEVLADGCLIIGPTGSAAGNSGDEGGFTGFSASAEDDSDSISDGCGVFYPVGSYVVNYGFWSEDPHPEVPGYPSPHYDQCGGC